MEILHLVTTDPAGSAIATVNAINRTTRHTARLITLKRIDWMNFEQDLYLPERMKYEDSGEVKYLLKNSDIIHIHKPQDWIYMGMPGQRKISQGFIVFRNDKKEEFVLDDLIKNKRVIYQHHGEPYLMSYINSFVEYYKRNNIRPICVTPEMLEVIENGIFIPNIVPLNDTKYLPRRTTNAKIEMGGKEVLVIGQSPTPTYDKGTKMLMQVVDRLAIKYKFLRLFLIQGLPIDECLRRKRICHIGIDHFSGWFGRSSLEFLSMGIPTIAGLNEFCVKKLLDLTRADKLPWIIARSEHTLESELTYLIENDSLRLDIGEKSRKWMETYWTEEIMADKFIKIYEKLLNGKL